MSDAVTRSPAKELKPTAAINSHTYSTCMLLLRCVATLPLLLLLLAASVRHRTRARPSMFFIQTAVVVITVNNLMSRTKIL